MDKPKIYNPDLPWIVVFSDGIQCHLIDKFLLKSEAEHLRRGLIIFLKNAPEYLSVVNVKDNSTWLVPDCFVDQLNQSKKI